MGHRKVLRLPDSAPSSQLEVMATEEVKPFHGDKDDENPEDFLCSFFRRMGTANSDTKKQQFKYFLQADSAADEWFDELQQNEKKDWDAIETAFNNHWPRKRAAKKTKEEYEKEITGLRLSIDDLGKRRKRQEETSTHISFGQIRWK